MYIDKDCWGQFSICDLTAKELQLIHEALKTYARCNFGNVSQENCARILRIDFEYNNIMGYEKETDKQEVDTSRW